MHYKIFQEASALILEIAGKALTETYLREVWRDKRTTEANLDQ